MWESFSGLNCWTRIRMKCIPTAVRTPLILCWSVLSRPLWTRRNVLVPLPPVCCYFIKATVSMLASSDVFELACTVSRGLRLLYYHLLGSSIEDGLTLLTYFPLGFTAYKFVCVCVCFGADPGADRWISLPRLWFKIVAPSCMSHEDNMGLFCCLLPGACVHGE